MPDVIATAAMDNLIFATDITTSTTTACITSHTDHVLTVDISPHAPHALYSASADCTVRRHDLRSPDTSPPVILLAAPPSSRDYQGISSAHISPCGRSLLVSSDGVRLFDVRKLGGAPATRDKALATFLPTHLHPDAVENTLRIGRGVLEPIATYAAFSPCGNFVVANFQFDAAYVFDVGGEAAAKRCARHGGRVDEGRKEALLCAVARHIEHKHYAAAIACCNELCSLRGGDGVRVRHLRCEALLIRGGVGDWRAALVDADFCAAAERDAQVSFGIGDQSVAENVWKAWGVVLALQRANAVFRMIVPLGKFVSQELPHQLDHSELKSVVETGRSLDYASELLSVVLKENEAVERASGKSIAALGELAFPCSALPYASFFGKVGSRLSSLKNRVRHASTIIADVAAATVRDLGDEARGGSDLADDEAFGGAISAESILSDLGSCLGRPALSESFLGRNVACGYRRNIRFVGHMNLHTS